MNKDKQQLAFLIGLLGETFRQKVTATTITAYNMALGDVPIEALETAVRRAMVECTFFPSARELRDMAGVMSLDARTLRAWEVFERAVVQHGYYASVNFDDPVLNATVRNLGGWIYVSEMGAEELDKWLRKDFERVYKTFCQQGVGNEQSAPLVGWHEKNNRHGGYPIPIGMKANCGMMPVMIKTELPLLPHIKFHVPARIGKRQLPQLQLKGPDAG